MKWKNTLEKTFLWDKFRKMLTKIPLIHNEVGKAEEDRSWVLIRKCTTEKSLVEREAKASAWLKEFEACSSFLTSYLTCFIIFLANSFPLSLTCQISSPFEITAITYLLKKQQKAPVAGSSTYWVYKSGAPP